MLTIQFKSGYSQGRIRGATSHEPSPPVFDNSSGASCDSVASQIGRLAHFLLPFAYGPALASPGALAALHVAVLVWKHEGCCCGSITL